MLPEQGSWDSHSGRFGRSGRWVTGRAVITWSHTMHAFTTTTTPYAPQYTQITSTTRCHYPHAWACHWKETKKLFFPSKNSRHSLTFAASSHTCCTWLPLLTMPDHFILLLSLPTWSTFWREYCEGCLGLKLCQIAQYLSGLFFDVGRARSFIYFLVEFGLYLPL